MLGEQRDNQLGKTTVTHFYRLCAQILLCADPPPPSNVNADLRSDAFVENDSDWAATPDDQRLIPLQCVRPVIWCNDDFPGFSGTSFLATALGHDLALTARHVTGDAFPANLAIPASLSCGPMELIEPAGIFWYNSGDYDHVSDLAIALLAGPIGGALDLTRIGFTSLEVGERAMTVGFPKALSRVEYDINDEHRRTFGVPDTEPFRALFVWHPDATAATCAASGGVAALGRLEFTVPFNDPDGMSGAPIFVLRRGKLWIAGMLVRANERVGHFIPGTNIEPFVARNLAKSPAIVARLLRVLVDGQGITGSPGSLIAKHVGECLNGLFRGDRARAEEALRDWPASGKSLADLVLERAGDELLRGVGGDELAMWEQHKLLRHR